MNRKGFAAVAILLIVVGILVVASVWYYESHRPASHQPAFHTTSGQNTATGTQETYTSKALGLSFEYVQDGTVIINESGTILTIASPGETQPDNLIEVFKKDPSQTFQQSVENLLSAQKLGCSVGLVASSTNYMPPAFNQQEEISDNSENSDQCFAGSVDYDDNGDAYFAYNSNFPDRFYFYDFGQSIWPEASNDPDPSSVDDNTNDWRATIQLMNFN